MADKEERKKTGDDLRRSEAMFRKFFEITQEGIAILDADTYRIIDANPSLQRLTGYTLEQLTGKELWEIESFREADRTQIARQLREKEHVHIEPLPIKTKERGSIRAEFVTHTYGVDGKKVIQCSIRDITERKRDEQKLRLQSEITENMFEGVVLIRASDGVIVYANPRFEQMFGYGSDELIGKNIPTVNAPVEGKNPEDVTREIEAGLEESGAWVGEVCNVKKDGTHFWCRVNVSVLESSEYGRIWVSVQEDITERKKMEEELRRLSQFRESVIDNAHVWIDVLDERANVVVWNKAAEAISGYSREEVIGHGKIWEWLYPDEEYRGYLTRLVADVFQHGRVEEDFETTIRRKDGQIRTMSWNERSLLDELGKAIGSIALGRDVTQHKKMEEEIRSLAEFPSENPNPVLRLDKEGTVLVANQASKAILREWNCELGQTAPKFWRDLVTETLTTGQSRNVDIEFGGRDFTFLVKPVVERSHVNLYGRDITERKRAEEALREASQFNRAVISGAREGIIVYDRHLNYRVWNRFMEELTGMSAEKVLGENALELFPHLRQQGVDLLLKRALSGETVASPDTPFQVSETGKSGWVSGIYGPHHDAKGEIVGVIGLVRDVSEHKRMEEELRRYSTQLEQLVAERTRELAASKDFAENLIQTANAIVVGLDNDGNVRFLNQAAERITGYTSKELEGRDWFEVIVPRVRYPEVWMEFERLRAGGLPRNFENAILTKSGEERYVVWQNSEVREQGKPVGTISFGIDITERKRAEEQLRATRERLEYVITSNPAVIYAGKPLADHSDFFLTYLSDRVVEMLGFEPSDFIGHPEFWERHVHPDDLHACLIEMPRLWKEGQYGFEYRFLHKDGSYRWIREEAKVVRDADGKPIEVNGYWIDVTERKQIEERLAESERLAAIGQTAAMVGHDLRNPLQGIAGIAYLVKRDLESRKAADRKAAAALLDTIQEQVVYMDKIVSDLQDYSQPLAPKLTETNLPNLIRQTLSTIKIPEAVKVTVEIEKPAENAMTDPTLMRRTLTNLTINAIQAMPKKGKLTIRARSKRDSTIMTVEDTGAGIPRKNFAKLFSPFFTTKAKGQGLGLAVCKRLVEAQGGTITVKSKPRKGTAFTIKLPRGRKEVAS
jgi:PAS domain S-box-containing protein